MKSDNEFYIIQKYFPNSFAKLGKRKYKSNYEQHSIELKALKDTKDSFLIPEDKNDPIIVIENQGYSEKNFFLRFNQGVSIFCYQNDYYGDVVKVAIFLKKKDINNSIMPIYNRDFICYTLSETTKDELESFNDDVLMSLLPLCKVTEKEIIDYTNVWKSKVEKNDSIKQSDKLTLYGIYSYFCNETFNKSINQINEILGVDVMITKLGKE